MKGKKKSHQKGINRSWVELEVGGLMTRERRWNIAKRACWKIEEPCSVSEISGLRMKKRHQQLAARVYG